jgi:hypothetical protein
MLNEHAQALGRLNRGVKKTMSKEAYKQRRKAAKRPRKKKLKIVVDSSETLS